MSLGQIKVVMTLDDNGFASRITQNGKALTRLNADLKTTAASVKSLDKHFTGLGHQFREFVVTTALAKGAIQNLHAVTTGAMLKIADTNGEIERMTALMKGMSTATTEAGKSLDAKNSVNSIFDMAKNAPVDIKALTDTYVKLKTTGIDPLAGSMQALVDANAHFGGNNDTLHRAAISIQQMASKGVISMEELRQQLAEAIPNASQLMARGMGLSIAELNDKISKGMVKSKEALAILFDEMNIEFQGSAKDMMNTWVGLTANLQTEWTLFQRRVGDASYFDEAKNAMRELTAAFRTDEANAAAAELGHTLGDLTKTLVDMTKYVIINRDEIAKWAKYAIEAAVAAKSWATLRAAVELYHLANLKAAKGLVELVAIVRTGGIAAGGASLMTSLAAGVSALGGPITLVTGLIVAMGVAWLEMGDKAQESLAKAEQALNDGVAVNKRALEQIVRDGEIAEKEMAARKRGGMPIWSFFQEMGDEAAGKLGMPTTIEKINNKRDAEDKLWRDTIAEQQRNREKLIEEHKRSISDIGGSVDADVRKKANDNYDLLVSHQIDKAEYDRRKVAVVSDAEKERLRLIDESTQKYINNAKAVGADTSKIVENANAQKEAIKEAARFRGEAQFNTFGEAKNKKDSAAKEAKKEADELANHIATLKAQLEKKKALLAGQSSEATGYSGPGPEEAKILSLMKSGKNYNQEAVDLARESDQVTAAYERQKKAIIDLDAIQRHNQKTNATLITDLQHMDEVIANGGYETMSKATQRYNEQLAVEKEKLDEVRDAMSPELYAKRLAIIEADTKALRDNAEALDLKRREAAAIPEAKAINASLITNTQERLDAEYALKKEAFMKERQLTQEMVDANVESHKNEIALLRAMDEEHARAAEHPMLQMARSWDEMSDNMRNASAGWMQDFTDGLAEMAITGKATFADLTKAILADIAKIMFRKAMAGLVTAAFDAMGAGAGYSGVVGSLAAATGGGFQGNGPLQSYQNKFANGGIMTPYGSLPLQKYANGGIARSPQVAIFGEGRQNEAYVPLPDGRTIPVTMKGGDGGNNVSIVINVDENGNATKNSGASSDSWGRMAESIKGIVLTTIAEQKRPGGLIYSH